MAADAAMLCCFAATLMRAYRSGSICNITVLVVLALEVSEIAMDSYVVPQHHNRIIRVELSLKKIS